MKIGIGSTNPVKIEAVRLAAQAVFSARERDEAIETQGFAVASGVSAQPFSDQETRQGAMNRAVAVLAKDETVELALGLEGGVYEEGTDIWNVVWVVVRDRAGREVAFSGNRFALPTDVADGLRTGQEMGDVMNALEGRDNLKHAEGMFGIITEGVITRTAGYQSLAQFALALYFSQRYNVTR